MLLILIPAFLWLLWETDWMRVRLPCDETIEEYDRRILKSIEDEYLRKEASYQAWLEKRYAPKLVYGYQDTFNSYPQDKWLSIEEDLANRRSGNMLYQRR